MRCQKNLQLGFAVTNYGLLLLVINIYVTGLLTEFHRKAKLCCWTAQIRIAKGSFYNKDLCFFLTGGQHYYFSRWFMGSRLTQLKHGSSAISVLVKTKSDGSEIKQMQLLCYDGTHKETIWLAVKSKGMVQVFRMFGLDRRLPKD